MGSHCSNMINGLSVLQSPSNNPSKIFNLSSRETASPSNPNNCSAFFWFSVSSSDGFLRGFSKNRRVVKIVISLPSFSFVEGGGGTVEGGGGGGTVEGGGGGGTVEGGGGGGTVEGGGGTTATVEGGGGTTATLEAGCGIGGTLPTALEAGTTATLEGGGGTKGTLPAALEAGCEIEVGAVSTTG